MVVENIKRSFGNVPGEGLTAGSRKENKNEKMIIITRLFKRCHFFLP